MNKKTIRLIWVILLLSGIIAYNFGYNKKRGLKKETSVDEIVVEGIKKTLNLNNNVSINNLNLVCQNQIRYLYTFDYNDSQKESTLAIEMIIDEENEYYFIGKISEYHNIYDDNCINLYE